MKKILFVIPSFEIGGTNTSLINMISNFDKSRFELNVYAINNQGVLRKQMEPYAKIINPLHGDQEQGESKENGLFSFFKSIFRFLRKCGVDLSPLYYKRTANSLSKIKYDCVIAFQEGNTTELVSYFQNVRKIAWVRSDYGRYLSGNNKKPEREVYNKFDYIVNVSETAKNKFLSFLPQYSDKTLAIYNLLNKDRVLALSKENQSMPGEDTFTLISVGRVDPVKHFSEIPVIAKVLKESGISFKWLILGGRTETNPEEYDLIESRIKEYELDDFVFLMGYQQNPYVFIKQSQLLVCLSESETFNHTFAEARLLGVPVFSVNYESAPEFIKNNEGGRIVERLMMTSAITEIISNRDLYSRLKDEIRNFRFDNQAIIEKVYHIVS